MSSFVEREGGQAVVIVTVDTNGDIITGSDGSPAILSVSESSVLVVDKKVRVAASLGVIGVGAVWKIPAIEKAFQVVIPSGATGSVDIEGSVDGVNFETLAPGIASTSVYVNQQPIPFWRANITAVAGLPASVFTTVTISKIEPNLLSSAFSNTIPSIEDAGTWYEWSGTGIGASILQGDYAQLNVLTPGQTSDDWTNTPFVIYDVVDANTIRIFDPAGVDRAVADTSIGMFPLLAVIAAY